MQISKYIYSFSYDHIENELCKLESKYLFNQEDKNKVLLTNTKVAPSNSAFIKNRLDVTTVSDDYATFIELIKKENICIDGFKVEYLVFDGDTTEYADRLKKLKDVGWSIDGDPDYYTPTTTYAIGFTNGHWCFGTLFKNDFAYEKHKKKPYSYSNSISIGVAKTLVNIAVNKKKDTTLLDACCGVGTIMLEACFAGYNIEGCDINWKICRNARENLAFFDYETTVYRSDIKDIEARYDAAIIDLPYNLFSSASDSDVLHIIESTAKISDKLVIVSTSDIKEIIVNAGFSIVDYCTVSKSGKRKFERRIWVCSKNIV